MKKRNKNSFILLEAFLRDRLTTPVSHFSFWIYFVLAVIGLGAVGVWTEIFRWIRTSDSNTLGILTAIYTYFPAIASGATLQLVMSSGEKYIRSFSLFMAFLIGTTAIPYSIGLTKETFFLWIWGTVGTLLTLFFWWIANGANQDFLDSKPEDTLGGSPAKDPKGDAGAFNV